MKKITYLSLLALLFSFVHVVAQNTASISGNWDDCSTWGNPTSIFQNNTDTKIINTGTNVAQNTAWSTNNVNFGTGNGSISFADNTKSIDFVTDGGNDKSCAVQPTGLTTNFCTITQTQSPAGAMVNNTSYTGTVTWSYTKTGTTATPYPGEIVMVNGLTLTRVAGNFAAATSGTVTYNLSGTYTGATGATVIFPLTLFTKSAQVTFTKDRLRNSIYNVGGSSLANYDAAATDTWVQVTATEYNAFTEAAATSNCGINQNDVSGSNLGGGNATSQGNTWGTSDYGNYNANGVPQANYILYAMAWNNAANNATGTGVNPLYLGTGVTSGYVSAVGPLLSATATSGANSYFVRKKSTLNIGSRIYIAGYNTASLYLDCYTSSPGNANGFGLRPFAGGNQAPNNSHACQGLQQLKLTAQTQW